MTTNDKEETNVIVDTHTHMINGKDLEKLAGIGGQPFMAAIEQSRKMTAHKPQTGQVAPRVAQLDRHHIDYQLATPVPTLDPNNIGLEPAVEVQMARAINDGMARITEESRGRIVCAGSVPLHNLTGEGIKEMERAVKTLGLKGFGIMTNVRGKPLDSPEFKPFWATAAKLEATIFLHPCDAIGHKDRSYEHEYDLMHVFGWPFETTLAICHLVFSGIMEEFPGLKIVTHHLGGMIPFYWGRIEESYVPELLWKTNVKLKKPLKEYFSRFYFDTAVGNNPGALRCSYELFGADQMVLATDAPFGPGTGDDRLEQYPKFIQRLGLPEADTRKILGENARRILNLG
ncbi:MAG: amidohydrolase [Chloroflexi bacterium]|nr:amidohydrolase [Chloroflexota bacterium]